MAGQKAQQFILAEGKFHRPPIEEDLRLCYIDHQVAANELLIGRMALVADNFPDTQQHFLPVVGFQYKIIAGERLEFTGMSYEVIPANQSDERQVAFQFESAA